MKTTIDSQARGSYILLIEIPREVTIEVGALGFLKFPQGYYAYCGSAMGGLRARINRHLGKEKKVRWHVDYLLLEEGRVKNVIYAPTHERLECQLAQKLENIFHSVPEFGSSDCRCSSHLFYSLELSALQEKATAFFNGLLKGKQVIIEEY
jgi:sugar fermentation stimulation protein A